MRFVYKKAYPDEEYRKEVVADWNKRMETAVENKSEMDPMSVYITCKDGTERYVSDVARQIDAIRSIYEKVYQSANVTRINVGEYITDLLSTVFSFNPSPVDITCEIKLEYLRPRTAVPLGLIINEVATNAIKHGFTNETKARFAVELGKDETNNGCVLTLSNTGNPFPENIDPDNPETLGLQLVSALVDQLKGTIELKRTPKPVFTIRFPLEECR